MELLPESSSLKWKHLCEKENMEYKKQSHCVYHCKYHIVISTKYRRKILNAWVMWYLKVKMKEILKYYPELEWKQVNWEKDHIHILASVPPKMSISEVVRILKCNTSNSLKSKFGFLNKVYRWTDWIRSDGYFVSTIGLNESVIARYIEYQGKEDTGQAKLELG